MHIKSKEWQRRGKLTDTCPVTCAHVGFFHLLGIPSLPLSPAAHSHSRPLPNRIVLVQHGPLYRHPEKARAQQELDFPALQDDVAKYALGEQHLNFSFRNWVSQDLPDGPIADSTHPTTLCSYSPHAFPAQTHSLKLSNLNSWPLYENTSNLKSKRMTPERLSSNKVVNDTPTNLPYPLLSSTGTKNLTKTPTDNRTSSSVR